MNGEVDIYGVYFPELLVLTGVALPLTALLRRGLAALGAYRLVWRAPLFDFALLVIVLGGLFAAQGLWQ
jgi:hypothetical protein